MLQLTPLYTFKAKGTPEKLGHMPDGERSKVEFRGAVDPSSSVVGKVHGTHWFLIGPLGTGQVESVQEIVTPEGDRFVIQLRGSVSTAEDGERRLKAAGVFRPGAARFMDLDGQIVLVEGVVRGGEVEVVAYAF